MDEFSNIWIAQCEAPQNCNYRLDDGGLEAPKRQLACPGGT
jgi:hypothetical protein